MKRLILIVIRILYLYKVKGLPQIFNETFIFSKIVLQQAHLKKGRNLFLTKFASYCIMNLANF